jgi:glutathione S-transferase
MEAKLYVILGSHACRTGMLLLEHKGIDYERVVLATGMHPMLLRLHGFSGNSASFRKVDDGANPMLRIADRTGTVPALLIDGERVKTNRRISRYLDDLQPDPPLFPPDPERRREVEEAERWGDEVLQMAARRLVLGGALHGRDSLVDQGDDGRLGPLLFKNSTVRLIGGRLFGLLIFGVNAHSEPDVLAAVPGMLDKVDEWVESGVLNGDELNAADFMIAPSLALLCYRRDVRSEVERRPAMRLVERVLPEPSRAQPGAVAA